MLTLFNTLTARQEPFESIEPKRVRMYVCGVTVYNEAHVGHAMSALVFDIIRRYLDRVAEILREGQRLGDLREDFDPGSTAVHFLGLIQPAATLWYLSAGKFDVTRAAERSFAQFIEAIEAPRPPEREASGQ